MHRRALLTVLGSGALSLAGCSTRTDTDDGSDGTDSGPDTPDTPGRTTTDTPTGGGETGTPRSADLPDDCPTSQGLGVEWPRTLDGSTVASFVEAYERAYYREVVVGYDPESQLDSYELGGSVTDPPRRLGDGWEVAYSGSGGVYRPTLLFGATTSTPPEGADLVPVSDIEDDPLSGMLREAAETGEAELHIDDPGEEVDRYVDLLASVSEDFRGLSGPGDSDTLYVDVDGTAVELSVQATNFHGDYWWNAWYYVDEHVVRRTDDEDTDPRNGKLLECRTGA